MNKVMSLAVLLCLNAAVLAAEPPPAAPKPAAAASATAEPKVNTSAPGTRPAAASTAKPAAAPRRAGADRIDLDTTVVTGNRELPKVLYIVPWKKSDIGDLPAQPFNTLLDEVLTPVDRDVFKREVTYYGALTKEGAAGPESAQVPAAPAGAK